MNIYVTNKKVSYAYLCSYDNRLHRWAAPAYILPTYELKVDNHATFEVIRTGLKRTYENPPARRRRCDVGIFGTNVCKPRWIYYDVHSGEGTDPGALQLWPHIKKLDDFLIHEGTPDRHVGWGTYGCIEVIGPGQWSRFVSLVKVAARRGQVTVRTEAIAKPYASLVVKDASVRKALGNALVQGQKRTDFELVETEIKSIIKSTYDGKVQSQELKDLRHIAKQYYIDPKGTALLDKFIKNPSKRI